MVWANTSKKNGLTQSEEDIDNWLIAVACFHLSKDVS